jgi:hypothetical protein
MVTESLQLFLGEILSKNTEKKTKYIKCFLSRFLKIISFLRLTCSFPYPYFTSTNSSATLKTEGNVSKPGYTLRETICQLFAHGYLGLLNLYVEIQKNYHDEI